MGETTVASATTTLIFKAEVAVRRYGCNYLIGNLLIPAEVFSQTEDPSVLELNAPWRLDLGERDIPGLAGLQRRISSADPKEARCFFIPSSYLLKIKEGS